MSSMSTCHLCQEDYINTFLLSICHWDKPESMMDNVCDHMCCVNCFKQWVSVQLNKMCHIITCPYYQCAGIISIYDIERLDKKADTILSERYKSILKQDFSNRPKPNVWEGCQNWEQDMPVECPTCGIYVYRWEGCETIYCICGQPFCSNCLCIYGECICTPT